MRRPSSVLAAFVLVVLAGAPAAQASRVMRALRTFIGEPDSVVIARFGQPDEVQESSGGRVLRWTRRVSYLSRSNFAMTDGNGNYDFRGEQGRHVVECTIEMTVDAQHVVVDVDYSGLRNACLKYVLHP